MKKAVIILALMLALLPAVLQAQKVDTIQIAEANVKEISVLNGTVILEISEGVEFHCIGIRLNDKNLNMGLGTCIEIKKRGEFYFTDEWSGKKHTNINDAIEGTLKEIFIRFYKGEKQKKRGKKVWSAFVKEDGLQLFIDFVNEIIDDEFLNSPFNETYG
ncbi:MAG: hypothetical protein LBV69_07015 [Bacteroidales bacterium]|nr:hypothetical protein [Bacteroidales bacterium]